MEGTYGTSDYMNNIMLKKYLVKTGDVSEKPKDYLEKKFSFFLTDHGTSIGQPAYLFYFAPVS